VINSLQKFSRKLTDFFWSERVFRECGKSAILGLILLVAIFWRGMEQCYSWIEICLRNSFELIALVVFILGNIYYLYLGYRSVPAHKMIRVAAWVEYFFLNLILLASIIVAILITADLEQLAPPLGAIFSFSIAGVMISLSMLILGIILHLLSFKKSP
jgi:hypothetical protein